MSQLVEDYKAGKIDLVTLDWTALSDEDRNALLIEIGLELGAPGEAVPVVPVKPIKSKNRGLANTIKYLAIAGLVFGAISAVVYFL